MPIKFLLLGGGGFWSLLEGGGGSANFIFMGVGIFRAKYTVSVNYTPGTLWARRARKTAAAGWGGLQLAMI